MHQKVAMGQPYVKTEIIDGELRSLNKLKPNLISPPIPTLSRFRGTYTGDIYYCDGLIWYLLHQKQPDLHDNPIGFRSRSQKDA